MKTISASMAIVILCLSGLSISWAAESDYRQTKKLFNTSKTIIGETITYPKSAPAKLAALEIVVAPGEKTAWHQHGAPLFAYILEGELVVDYGEHGEKVYVKGDAFMEAMASNHQGRNDGDEPVVILALFLGAEGYDNVIKKTAKAQ